SLVLIGNRKMGDATDAGAKGIAAAARIGGPMATRNIQRPLDDFPFCRVFTPEAVSMLKSRFAGFSSAREAAAQRMPLPDISASLPSALKNRMCAEFARSCAFITTIKPSAPAPV